MSLPAGLVAIHVYLPASSSITPVMMSLLNPAAVLSIRIRGSFWQSRQNGITHRVRRNWSLSIGIWGSLWKSREKGMTLHMKRNWSCVTCWAYEERIWQSIPMVFIRLKCGHFIFWRSEMKTYPLFTLSKWLVHANPFPCHMWFRIAICNTRQCKVLVFSQHYLLHLFNLWLYCK